MLEIILPLFGERVTFHIVSDDFPISQSGILGDFFKQTSSKIDYAKGYLDVSEVNVLSFHQRPSHHHDQNLYFMWE